jgi:extradiol dioxygenase family protein
MGSVDKYKESEFKSVGFDTARSYEVQRHFTAIESEMNGHKYRGHLHNNALKQLGDCAAKNHTMMKTSFIYKKLGVGGWLYLANKLEECPPHLRFDGERIDYILKVGYQK